MDVRCAAVSWNIARGRFGEPPARAPLYSQRIGKPIGIIGGKFPGPILIPVDLTRVRRKCDLHRVSFCLLASVLNSYVFLYLRVMGSSICQNIYKGEVGFESRERIHVSLRISPEYIYTAEDLARARKQIPCLPHGRSLRPGEANKSGNASVMGKRGAPQS